MAFGNYPGSVEKSTAFILVSGLSHLMLWLFHWVQRKRLRLLTMVLNLELCNKLCVMNEFITIYVHKHPMSLFIFL